MTSNMDEEAALRAKIAALAGQIDERKQIFGHPHAHAAARGHHRWSPYVRGGRASFHKPHKNRTLIIAGAQNATVANPDRDAPNPLHPTALLPAGDAFISTRGAKANQLMTKHTFEREQKQRQELQATQQKTKRPKLGGGLFIDQQVARPATQPRELEIDGIRFQLKGDGSKLMRVPDTASAGRDTPKKAKVADVDFLRTKNGNLLRVSAHPGDHRYYQEESTSVDAQDLPFHPDRPIKRAPKAQCENFTKYGTLHLSYIKLVMLGQRSAKFHRATHAGTCTFGPSCKFSHNPTKIAICKELMRNGSCQSRKTCDMSHELTYHRVPACTHFLRGNCTNNACRYPHVHVSPTARVCRAFATLGFCAQGPDCDDRHVFECPDYANHGHCAALEKASCSLQHVDRAGALRKAEKRRGKTGPDDDSDMSSDEEEEKEEGHKQAAYDSESDVDTDVEMGTGGFEQQDFMAIS